MSVIKEIYDFTLKGDYKNIGALVEKAIAQGSVAYEIIDSGLSKAMIEVGDKFGSGELYMPDMLLAAKTMQTAMEKLKPFLTDKETNLKRGTLVIGTVKGDLHDIGKNLVITMAEGQGFEVIDLGIDVDFGVFVDAIIKHKPEIVAFSGLLTTTLANIPAHVKAIEEAGLRDKVTIAVGGAPVTRDFADRYGIEIYAEDASTAAKEFIKAVEGSKNN